MVPVSLHLQPRAIQVGDELERAMNAHGEDLAPAALGDRRGRYPSLDNVAVPRDARSHGGRGGGAHRHGGAVRRLGPRVQRRYPYDELGFRGNRHRYDDPRNSFLNEVLNRRTGIPISLAVVYLEVARRAGLRIAGVNFPATSCCARRCSIAPKSARRRHPDRRSVPRWCVALGTDCRELLRQHVGDAAAFVLDSYHSEYIAEPGAVQPARNWMRWQNPELDRIIEEIRGGDFNDLERNVELGRDFVRLHLAGHAQHPGDVLQRVLGDVGAVLDGLPDLGESIHRSREQLGQLEVDLHPDLAGRKRAGRIRTGRIGTGRTDVQSMHAGARPLVPGARRRLD